LGESKEVLIRGSSVWKTSLGRPPLLKYLPKIISCYFSIQQTFMAALKDFDLKAVVGKVRPTNPDSFSRWFRSLAGLPALFVGIFRFSLFHGFGPRSQVIMQFHGELPGFAKARMHQDGESFGVGPRKFFLVAIFFG